MPNRILRDGILSSERVDALASWASECFYRRLHSIVDDFGRYYANPSLIRAAAYPLKLDKVSNADVEKWLADCAGAALVSTYEVEGKRYLQLLDFRQHARAAASKFPSMPIGCTASAPQPQREGSAQAPPLHPKADTDTDTKTESKAKASRANGARQSPMPPDFGISERVRQWAIEKGFDRLEEHLESFRRKCAAKGYTYVEWDDAFMEAIREDWGKLRRQSLQGAQVKASARAAVEAFIAKGTADAAS